MLNSLPQAIERGVPLVHQQTIVRETRHPYKTLCHLPADLIDKSAEPADVAGHWRELHLLLCDAAAQTAALVTAPGVQFSLLCHGQTVVRTCRNVRHQQMQLTKEKG